MKKSANKDSETAIAAVVVRHFLDLGAEVYQEVALGSRADIVAKIGSTLHVIEVKTSMSLWLIEQAWGWREHAHRVSIAVPNYRRGNFAGAICKNFGIGLYGVETASHEWKTARATEHIRPVFRRRVSQRLFKALREEQKTYAAAGNADSKFWSPRKAVAAALREAVTLRPGMTWREAMQQIKHHYGTDSSAASSFSRLFNKWPSVRRSLGLDEWLIVSDERPQRLYLVGSVVAPAQEPQLTLEAPLA